MFSILDIKVFMINFREAQPKLITSKKSFSKNKNMGYCISITLIVAITVNKLVDNI